MVTQLTDEIRMGVEASQDLPGVVLNSQPQWDTAIRCWVISCYITADVKPGGLIPETTRWFLHFDDVYPFGRVAMFPAKEGGVTQTFPHQRYNGTGDDSRPWRTGNICTETDTATLRRSGYDTEPADAENNLSWHLLRTQKWLELASRDELDQPGDPYELPDIPFEGDLSIAFCEGRGTHQHWSGNTAKHGTADSSLLPTYSPTLVITKFVAGKRHPEIIQEWQKPITGDHQQRVGWIRLAGPPTLHPHRIPITCGELRDACERLGSNLDADLKEVLVGTASDMDILLIGFPIQDKIKGPAVRTHWLAMKIPSVIKFQERGFRANPRGKWLEYRSQRIHDQKPLIWLRTENWHSSEINNRGKLAHEASEQRILVIGAGAVGSTLSEMLARAGAHQITLMDYDELEAGNLVRHTLLLVVSQP